MSRDTPTRPTLGSWAAPLPYSTILIPIPAGTMATLLGHARQSGCWDFFSRPNLLALLGCLQDSTNEVGAARHLTHPTHVPILTSPPPADQGHGLRAAHPLLPCNVP